MTTRKLPLRTTLCLALGALAGLPLAAQAQSSVTLYGLVDLGFGHYKSRGFSQTTMESGQDAPSRFGLRGTEDLGGGLSAVFKLEGGFSADTGAGPANGGLAFNRESYVGLAGSFGRVELGRVWSVTDDPFSVHRFTNFSAYIFPEFGHFDRTYGNALKYTTPNLSGWQGSAVYSIGEGGNSTLPNRARELGLSYEGGPLAVWASYSDTRNDTGSDADKLIVLSGRYRFGPVLARGAYYDSKPRGTGLADAKAFLLGADYEVAPLWTVGADVLHRKVDTAGMGSTVYRVLTNYELSRRTGLYAYAARLNNRGSDTQSFRGAVDPGAGQTGINVGIRHRF